MRVFLEVEEKVTCNVCELRHHIGWFDEICEVFAVDDNGKRYEIYKMIDVQGFPVLKIREVKDGR